MDELPDIVKLGQWTVMMLGQGISECVEECVDDIVDCVEEVVDDIIGPAEVEREVRILMLGLDAAGKTTILYKAKLGERPAAPPTMGFNVETVYPHEGLAFTVWDVGGLEKIRPLWTHYYKDTEGLFFVVDSSDVERLAECRETLQNVLSQDEMRGVPLVVMANKQDMPHALTISEITTKLDLRKLCAQRDWHVQGTSATSGAGICEALEAMAKFVGKRNL